MASPGHRIAEIRRRDGAERAILFVHGFSGDHAGTWGLFPTLIESEASLFGWDILSLGYATSLQPDVRGIWSADPDLPILAIHLKTRLEIAPLHRYASLAIVAHSMGGLVVQRALLDNPALVPRVSHLLFFGTPSGGLRKARWMARLISQIANMAAGSAFITALRSDWSEHFGEPPFRILVVAGDRDQFVPPQSSLMPFPRRLQRVVAGDHLSMVKPEHAGAESVALLISVLTAQPEPAAVSAPLRTSVMEMSQPEVEQALADRGGSLTQPEVVNAAIKLDLDKRRDEAIALLERHQSLGTDVRGTLGGRFKRLWLETGEQRHAVRALALYRDALETSRARGDHAQVYYHAINVAFLTRMLLDRVKEAAALARLALEHCRRAPDSVWRLATEAEAKLYLGERDEAFALYEKVLERKPEHWQLLSTGQQAYQIAVKLADQHLQERLQTLFNPESRHLNRVFVSYSHQDREWLERLRRMMRPYTRSGELDPWTDQGLTPGQQWFAEIERALSSCKVAVLLVSDAFLDSDFIEQTELPAILRAAEQGAVSLLWVYLSPALYEATRIAAYQPAHVPLRPLISLSRNEQDETLKQIAVNIRTAVFDHAGS